MAAVLGFYQLCSQNVAAVIPSTNFLHHIHQHTHTNIPMQMSDVVFVSSFPQQTAGVSVDS